MTSTETRAQEFDAELSPAERKLAPVKQSDEEQSLARWVGEQHRKSAEAKRLLEQQWMLATAYEEGNQWVELKAGIGLRNLQDENDPARSYVTCNLIRPLKNKVKARATMSKPDASVAPESERQLDILATPEARDIIDHYDRLFKRQQQSRLWCDSALICSTSFLKIVWDSSAVAAVRAAGLGDGAGGFRHVFAPVGDIRETIVPAWEIFPDPRGRSWDEVGWICHAKRHPLAYFQERYPRGQFVKPDSTSTYEYMETRLDWVLGSNARLPNDDKSALLLEYWELPTERFPNGRIIHVAGDIVLESNDLPYDFCIERRRLPFVPLQYETRVGSLWAPNLVSRLIPLQYYLNLALSRIQDRLNSDRMVVMIPEGSEVGVDAYESIRMLIKISYQTKDPMAKPEFVTPPPVQPAAFEIITNYKGLMEDIAGVHEVSNGQVPAGVTAGNAIELLMQSDTTQMSEFTGNIEQAQAERAEWEIALASQYYKEERLISVSTAGDPGQVRRQVGAFEALRAGGRVRVTVTPGSATPKTPAARIQQYMDFAHAGLFLPQQLPVLKALSELMGMERSDVLNQRIDGAIKEIQAMQPDPAAIQQMKSQQAQQAQLADQQHAAGIEAVRTHGKIESESARIDKLKELEYAKADAKARAEGGISDAEHERNLELQEAEHHHAAAMLHAQSVVPSAQIKIPLKLGPRATIGLEEMLGLPPDDPNELMQPAATGTGGT